MRLINILQQKDSILKFVLLYAAVFAFLIMMLLIGLKESIPFSHFSRDALAVANAPIYYGFVSNVGILLWCATASVCLFTFKNLRGIIADKNISYFILFGGMITSVLLFDDFFLLHEHFFPLYLGLSEKLVFAIYGLLVFTYIVVYRKTILNTRYIFLIFAFIFFSLSLLFDLFHSGYGSIHYFFEDGSKFIGIFSWFLYYFFTTRNVMNESFQYNK